MHEILDEQVQQNYPSIDEALEKLRAAGWTCIPPFDPNAEIPEPVVGQVWVSPKTRTRDRIVVKITPNRWNPDGEMIVYYTAESETYTLAVSMSGWRNWARRSRARPKMEGKQDDQV